MPYSPNYGFIIETLAREAGEGGRVLDFGCGGGELVNLGRMRGLDIVGADVAPRKGAGPHASAAIKNGRLPFPDAHFDAVCANQVFEHVHDLNGALTEISRVLRPGGVLLSITPTSEVWREGHCGIALANRFQQFANLQFAWLVFWRALGFGSWTAGKARVEWAAQFVDYLQHHTCYRRSREIAAMQSRMIGPVTRHEAELAEYRLRRPLPSFLKPLAAFAVVRLANVVMVARKPDAIMTSIRNAA